MATREAIFSYLQPLITRGDEVLDDVTITPAGKSRVISVVVDHETRNLSLDEVTSISRKVSEALDTFSDLGDKPFTLEVTSPGVDRPLVADRHWRKNIGRLVKITTADGHLHAGRIKEFSDRAVIISLPHSEESISRESIKRAIIEIEFNRKVGA